MHDATVALLDDLVTLAGRALFDLANDVPDATARPDRVAGDLACWW